MNFGAMKTLLTQYLKRNDLSSFTGQWINAAIKKTESDRDNFPYMATSKTGDFVYGTTTETIEGVSSITGDVITGDATSLGSSSTVYSDLYLDIPAQYKEMIALFLVDSDGNRILLEHKDYVQAILDFNNFANDTGQIKTYTTLLETSRFLLRTRPDKQYTYDMRFYRYSDELTDATDENWLMVNYWQIPFYGALIEAEPFVYNDARAATWLEYYRDAVDRLRRQYKNEYLSQSTRKVYARQLTT